MTEKIELMEIHAMRGHSRGEWYCSLDDIAPSEDEAEYWAIFGVTHRGNRHCLGEFPTKSAAEAAARGLMFIRRRVQPPPPIRGRKIIQIEIVPDGDDRAMVDIFALCEDGTIWRRGVGIGKHSGLIDDQWQPILLDGIEDLAPEEAFGVVTSSSP